MYVKEQQILGTMMFILKYFTTCFYHNKYNKCLSNWWGGENTWMNEIHSFGYEWTISSILKIIIKNNNTTKQNQ